MPLCFTLPILSALRFELAAHQQCSAVSALVRYIPPPLPGLQVDSNCTAVLHTAADFFRSHSGPGLLSHSARIRNLYKLHINSLLLYVHATTPDDVLYVLCVPVYYVS